MNKSFKAQFNWIWLVLAVVILVGMPSIPVAWAMALLAVAVSVEKIEWVSERTVEQPAAQEEKADFSGPAEQYRSDHLKERLASASSPPSTLLSLPNPPCPRGWEKIEPGLEQESAAWGRWMDVK